jgi:hypothetical protein
MPNDNFNLMEFVDSQLTPQERERVEGVLVNEQIDYQLYASQLEKILLENLIKYQGTAQSSDLKTHIAILLQPLADKLQGNLELE